MTIFAANYAGEAGLPCMTLRQQFIERPAIY
jgi:hypothetical protein